MQTSHFFQLALLLVSLVGLRRVVHQLLWRDDAHDARLGKALVRSFRAQDVSRARVLSEPAVSFIQRLGLAVIEALEEGSDIGIRLDETVREFHFELGQHLRRLRLWIRLGSASALVGVAVQFLWLSGEHHGLADLVPGLPESLATERGVLAGALGFAISITSAIALFALRKQGRRLLRECRTLADTLELTLHRSHT